MNGSAELAKKRRVKPWMIPELRDRLIQPEEAVKTTERLISITELKKRVEKMSNGEKAAYLGISGVEVTKEAHDELGVPYGAFVKEVAMDSPAMLAGIQQGDVLVQVVDKDILSYNEYIRILMEMKVGDTVELTVMRLSQEEYKEMKFQVTLGVME